VTEQAAQARRIPTPEGTAPAAAGAPDSQILLLAFVASLTIDVYCVFNNVRGDIGHYWEWGGFILDGRLPYRDFLLQYPPYCIPWFVLSRLADTERHGVRLFTAAMGALDALMKVLLLQAGFRWLKGWKAWVPFAVFTAAGAGQYFVYLKRFDPIPAAMVLVAVVLFARGAWLWSGVMVALGIGTKLYPALLVPGFLAIAWRRGQARPFLIGFVAGLAPLALLAAAMPWWNFLALHGLRGLQVESLYAGVLWLAHYAGADITWGIQAASFEVRGDATEPAMQLARVLLAGTVVTSVAVVTWAGFRDPDIHPGRIARLALLPILAFVAFNFVLSPQFMIWIITLAALAMTERWSWPLAAILLAEALTPLIYPTKTYRTGLNLERTIALNVRNISLAVAWVGLLVETIKGSMRERVRAAS
jgi:uncharacterized membrane protein